MARCVRTEASYFEIGNEVVDIGSARIVRNHRTPDVYDANCVTRVRAKSSEVDELMGVVDRLFSGVSHRSFKIDPFTPTEVEARLVLDGFESDTMVHLVLADGVPIQRAVAATPEIRPVSSQRDWESLANLARADHEEAAARNGRRVWPVGVTRQMVDRKRLRSEDMPYLVAAVDGRDVAYVCTWTGTSGDGVGMVEDLFTEPGHRHRGVATALITEAVARARAGGAGAVMIGAAAEDTPRLMYAALGFRALFVTRSYLRLEIP